MKVILTADVKKVGQRGTLVTVADGYANNVLLPRKWGIPATAQNIAKWEKEQATHQERKANDVASAKKLLAELEGKSVTVQAKANETGGLFVAVHEKEIAAALQKQFGISVSPDAITLNEQIKKLGEFRVGITLSGVLGELVVQIVKIS